MLNQQGATMPNYATPDLFDANRDSVDVADSGLIHYGGKTKFCGLAVTVTCPEDNSKAVEILTQPGAGKILVIDGFASKKYAFLGDQMAETAVKNHWQGIIINACVRDIEILATMPLGVMALGTTPRSTLKRGVGDLNQSVSMLGICIKPNNWLYADVNGLISSPVALF